MKPCELWFWLQQAEVAMYNNVPRRCRVDPSAVGARMTRKFVKRSTF